MHDIDQSGVAVPISAGPADDVGEQLRVRTARPLICLLCPGQGSRAGGIGRFVEALVAEVGSVDPAIELRVIDTRGSGHILAAPFHFALALCRIVAVSRCGRPVLLHVNLAERGSTVRKLMVSALASLLGLPTIIHLHAADYEGFLATVPAAGRHAISWMFRRSRRVVVLGEAWRRSIIACTGVPAQQVIVIPNGVKRRMPAADRAEEARPHIVFWPSGTTQGCTRIDPRPGRSSPALASFGVPPSPATATQRPTSPRPRCWALAAASVFPAG